jgi:hypothetical protein
MSVPRIFRIGPSCVTNDGRFQAAELDNSSFVLVVGEIRVEIRRPLPIDPGDKVKIYYYVDFSELQTAWDACEVDFENSGDHESATRMRAAWDDVWDEVGAPT